MIGKNILFVLLNKIQKEKDGGGSGIEGSYAILDYSGLTNSNYRYAIKEISDVDLSAQTTCASAFQSFGYMTSIGKVKTSSSCTSMTSMFNDCAKLTSIDLSELVTSNVTSMANMFQYDGELLNLNLGSFNTTKVTSMSYMFSGCSKLTNITFGTGFTLSSCVSSNSLQNMFSGCNSLSNETLGNIIDLLVSYGGSSNKNLKYIGLSSSQASYCESLDWWLDLEDLGWTTGY